MLREKNQTFKISFILLDLCVSFLAFAAAFFLHFYVLGTEERRLVTPDLGGVFAPGKLFGGNPELVLFGSYFYLGLFLTVVQVMVFVSTDLYHPRRGLSYVRETWAITRGVFLSLTVALAVLFFYRGTSFSRKVILYTAVFSVVFISFGHVMFRQLLGVLRARGYNIRRVLIIGTGAAARRFHETLKKHAIYGYQVVGLLGPSKGAGSEMKSLIAGGIRDLKKASDKLKPDLVVYAIPIEMEMLQTVLEFCDSEGIDCRIVPDLVELITSRARLEDMDGIPILTVRDTPLKNGYNRAVKRTFDIVFSLTVLLVLLPVFVLLGLLIKLTSRGPVFFRQERIGLDRRIFHVYKFRTMVTQEKQASDTIWGHKGDARVTSIGRILRKTSLDELPQFLNVLLGDMSVVGPRPERPHFVYQFKSKYTHYMRRHSVKAGITGWAQVQGWRGDTSIEKRVEADIYYIENWSFWMDVAIVFRTLPALLKSPGE
ncbi:MAG: undecaprenyl-phosphate glucose phosphotransferase [Spirochaetia bacterium]|nr:undecaprenyl-phosphate glucose phosphotransferase [Spirochaetia bacterium]